MEPSATESEGRRRIGVAMLARPTFDVAYATEAVVPAASCFRLPPDVSFELGAACLVQVGPAPGPAVLAGTGAMLCLRVREPRHRVAADERHDEVLP